MALDKEFWASTWKNLDRVASVGAEAFEVFESLAPLVMGQKGEVQEIQYINRKSMIYHLRMAIQSMIALQLDHTDLTT